MFRKLEDFTSTWKEEAGRTLQIFDAIPDGSLGTSVAEGHRDLRRMAWHLVESLIEMPEHWGLEIAGKELMKGEGIKAIVDPPATMAEIHATYQRASDSLLKELAAWKDATLDVEDDMYGMKWKRGLSLFVLITHQVHHRGQMTVLMRQANLKVPGIYGPAKEDWAGYGAPPPRV